MTDLHTHILPGLDDGARDLYDTLAMADLAVRSGTTPRPRRNAMRKVVVHMAVSLDGFFEGPDHDINWHRVDDELHASAAR